VHCIWWKETFTAAGTRNSSFPFSYFPSFLSNYIFLYINKINCTPERKKCTIWYHGGFNAL